MERGARGVREESDCVEGPKGREMETLNLNFLFILSAMQVR